MHPLRSVRALSLAIAGIVAFASGTAAQGIASPASDSASSTPLFSIRDAVVAGGFAGLTAAMFPLDQRIAHRLADPGTQANRFFHHAATGVELIASPGAYVIGGSLYAVGRLAGFERVADLGLHGTEAVLVSDVIMGPLKGLAGRARPFVTSDTDAADFSFGKGFTNDDRTSFPSGHTTTAFAAAAAVTAETGRWWPRSTWVVGPLMYGGAAMVGLSRMYHNKHWASDVALGAAIGTFSGQKTVQFLHARPRNAIDRILLGAVVAPTPKGLAIGWRSP
jgi:membrane-associated phospholipid phosphatase